LKKIPVGVGSGVTMTGIGGAVVAFLVAWIQNGLT
jgi:fucose permease